MLTDQQLQSLRNLGNEAEDAVDEIVMLRSALTPGWRFERDDMNRIIVTMPDGGGCVVDNVANDRRMVPEEVLFALCKALGA